MTRSRRRGFLSLIATDRSRSLAGRYRPGRRLGRIVYRDAAPQRLHEIDGAARDGPARFRRWWHAGLLGVEMRHQGLLIAVAEAGRIEGGQLAVENLRRKPEQFGRRRQVRNVREIVLRIANFVDVPIILPTSVRSSRSITVGIRFTGAVSGGDGARSAPPGTLSTSRRRPARASVW